MDANTTTIYTHFTKASVISDWRIDQPIYTHFCWYVAQGAGFQSRYFELPTGDHNHPAVTPAQGDQQGRERMGPALRIANPADNDSEQYVEQSATPCATTRQAVR
jgi:hypothetical protein